MSAWWTRASMEHQTDLLQDYRTFQTEKNENVCVFR